MSMLSSTDANARDVFNRVLGELRPKLHRYTARMTGSAIDGEDVVQDAMLKAIEAFSVAGTIVNVEGWMFRIIHNTTLDYLRRRGRQSALYADSDPDMVADPASVMSEHEIAATSLRTFMQLPPAHRSCVILMDVLGHSLQEIADLSGLTIPAVKAALHKGRLRLRELAQTPDGRAPSVLDEAERGRLAAYVDRFNARDFDALRDLLADDVRLDLLGKSRLQGRKDVSRYFENYARLVDLRVAVGMADGRLALLVFETDKPAQGPIYIVVLEWREGRIAHIRDFHYARYAMADIELGG
ncbi:sigma-70 family RNA polymerase sigma factor [Bradyrhizobium prioriisuperbiae]|uniref:sigma-70 family RNA polymerase sigma factor n=1 Tax=Bradyrhizobium prioriisuperbiae TaxID=2854389 RepID=UPI0028E631CE|nr:sigma-70 family RNA polymerase sigma factor [Bradyrhizobium prioritasuperba]